MKKFLIIIILFTLVGLGSQFGKNLFFRIGIQNVDMKSDLWEINMQNLALNKTDMQGTSYGLGYEFFLNRNMSVDIEAGTYKKVRNTMYRDFTYSDDSPILQNLSLNVSSIEFNLNLLPLGYRRNVYPYLSAGGGVYLWTFEQWGEFINFTDESIYEGYATSQKVSFGANGKAGIMVRVGKNLGISIEGKYRYLKGALGSEFEGFDKLDLNGWTFSFGVHYFLW